MRFESLHWYHTEKDVGPIVLMVPDVDNGYFVGDPCIASQATNGVGVSLDHYGMSTEDARLFAEGDEQVLTTYIEKDTLSPGRFNILKGLVILHESDSRNQGPTTICCDSYTEFAPIEHKA